MNPPSAPNPDSLTPKWTAPQRRAIQDEGGALLVSAAAGSGKTTVLVERAVRAITQPGTPADAARLLILTFTNAAAEQLRSSIARRLEKELRAHPGDANLRHQRLQLRRAFIGTMDAFCQQLVREHFIQLELPPDIAVGDAALLGRLSSEALAETMEEMYADDDFAALAAMHGQARSDFAAEEAILRLFRHSMTLPFPQRQLARFAALYSGAPLRETVWARALLAQARQGLEEAERLAAWCHAAVCEAPGLAPYRQAMANDLSSVRALSALAGAGDWDGLVAGLAGHTWARLVAVRGEEEAKTQVQARREALKKLVAELASQITCTEADYQADNTLAAPMVAALCRAAGEYARRYTAAKLAEKALDFDDFTHYALCLLQTEDGARTPLADAVSARYDAVMVDEYQDTNELQDALYRSLAAPDGANLFFVGDAKQSIYRFRQANPGIFIEKREQYRKNPPGSHPMAIDLGHNFRSSRAVIDGVNYLFGALMSHTLGEMDYDEAQRLIPGGAAAEAPGAFAVRVVQGGGPGGEAAFVARRIAEMMRQKPPTGVWKDGKRRDAEYGDFCILLRARKHMPAFVQALQDEGIPVAADLADNLLDTPEVLALAAVLRAIDNPGDDVSLAAALLGPLGRFTPDEMAALRLLDRRGRLWAALVASETEKSRAFVEEMRGWRALAAAVPVGRLCEELVGRTGYLSAVAAMQGGEARRENLLRFVGWAAAVGAGLRGGLAGFVRLLNAGKGPQPPAAKTMRGHVALLTIHKSKGLEFPFVFLADAAHPFQLSGFSRRVQVHTDLGVGLVLRGGGALYPSVQAVAIRARAQREELSEEMRLLYVALTRAKQQLTVSFTAQNLPKLLAQKAALLGGGAPGPAMLLAQRSMAHWLLCALLCHPDGTRFLRQQGVPVAKQAPPALEPPPAVPAFGSHETEGRFDIQAVALPPADAGQEEKTGFALSAVPDGPLVEKLVVSFGESAPLRALAGVPAKLSVSALAKQGAGNVRKRPSFMYASGLSAAERGTAQHSFLQFANFALAAQNPAAEVERLRRAGYMGREMANAVDVKGVAAFFASPLYARVRGAKKVLREYDFITAVPARAVKPDIADDLAETPVLVQGIADMVLLGPAGAEIVDYKTDGGADAATLATRYAAQLRLYRQALQKRLGLPVQKLTIWSFALGAEVDIAVDTQAEIW